MNKTILFICAFEAIFWLAASSLSPQANPASELAERWTSNVATDVAGEIEPPSDCLSAGRGCESMPPMEHPKPMPAKQTPETHPKVPRADSDGRCNTGEVEKDGTTSKTPKKGEPSPWYEQNWGLMGWLVVALSISALSTTLFGHGLVNTPLKHLGANSGAGFNTLVWGYDSARGEFSSLATACIFSPLLLPLIFLPTTLLCVAVAALLVLAVWYRVGMHASHPGGPRPHRILREPAWSDKTWQLPPGWRCAVAEESHGLTAAALPGEMLTGEPAGRQTWHTDAATPDEPSAFSFNPSVNPNPEDLVWRAQRIEAWKAKGGKVPDASWQPEEPLEYLRKAMSWYQILQAEDGHWAGDYGGPHFLMPGLVIVWYITGKLESVLTAEHCAAMSHYLLVHQQLDGGWGMHIESPSTMFGSCMCYMALRLLGLPAEHPAMVKGREFIHSHGGGLYTGSWAKLYMCLLGVMEWSGHNVIPPEMWLLPEWFPFHPGRLWCHCRMVYLPMCYLYGVKFVYPQAETDPVIASLRRELYTQEYHTIQWEGTADLVADVDNYSPVHPIMKAANALLDFWEGHGGALLRAVRRRGLEFALDYMHAEDEQTNYVCIGPVNKVLNMLCLYHATGHSTQSSAFQKHTLRVADYLWVSEDGMKMQGYNGSQGWDASFTMQALAEAELVQEFPEMCCKAYSYLERTQILSTPLSQAEHPSCLPAYLPAWVHTYLRTCIPCSTSHASISPPCCRLIGPLIGAGQSCVWVRDPRDAPQVLPTCERGRLAVLHCGARLADLGLHC